MAQVTEPKPAARYHEGQGNKILAITPVQSLMVRYTNPEGRESMAFIYAFGEAIYDKSGKKYPGIWVAANEAQLTATLRQAPLPTALAIIASMEEKGLIKDGKIVGGTPSAAIALPDVSDVFQELDSEGKMPPGSLPKSTLPAEDGSDGE